jgi:hypothetical protein
MGRWGPARREPAIPPTTPASRISRTRTHTTDNLHLQLYWVPVVATPRPPIPLGSNLTSLHLTSPHQDMRLDAREVPLLSLCRMSVESSVKVSQLQRHTDRTRPRESWPGLRKQHK